MRGATAGSRPALMTLSRRRPRRNRGTEFIEYPAGDAGITPASG